MRRLLTALLVAGVALGFGTAGSAQEAANDGAAFERLATCSRDTGRLQVLLLMDESGSLQWTDADDRRVIAAQTAVLSLAALGDDEGVTVEVALSSFAVDFSLVTGWSQLDSDSAEGLLADVRTFQDRNLGLDTDYHNAFTGVRDELSRRAAETGDGSRPCQLLLLFTDGDYDVEPRERGAGGQRGQNITKVYAPDLPLDQPGNPALVEERGRELLCEGGGLLDELRESDIVTVTLALEEDIDPEASTFLRAVTTGEARTPAAGTSPAPSTASTSLRRTSRS
jgi:hypothetical protein